MRRGVTATLVATAVSLTVAVPAVHAATSTSGGEVRDLVIDIRDLSVPVGSLDGGDVTAESSQEVEVTLSADVLFAFDKADLNAASGDRMKAAAAEIQQKAKGIVRIDGYTDAVGNAAYNNDLSLRRAQSVEAALRSQLGAAKVDLAVQGHGSADPVADNTKADGSDNPEGRAKNRRVVISFQKK